jgi:hypothetical protein
MVDHGDVVSASKQLACAVFGPIVNGKNMGRIANYLIEHIMDMLDFVVNRNCGKPARHSFLPIGRGNENRVHCRQEKTRVNN